MKSDFVKEFLKKKKKEKIFSLNKKKQKNATSLLSQ